jgi:UDP-2,3-diacylglucosamine hydrolase
MNMIHFLADLHLAPSAPGIVRLFFDYLDGRARDAEQVFILGDLFDAWPGDDALDDPGDSFARDLADRLRALTTSGIRVLILHGNRDFLLGERFSRQSGAFLLPEPQASCLYGRRFILLHGDTLCLDDPDYQSFRTRVRAPGWRADFLARPLVERKAIIAAMRRQSEEAKRQKEAQAMDLNAVATDDFLRQHGGATMIHGHTHLPGRHEHLIDGARVERWTLADWREGCGEYLAWDGDRLLRHTLVPDSVTKTADAAKS